ncbi:MAG: helix-turn-helix transcriptional regulator [Pseudonocardiales bacterium]|nr:helix-turn-helix transcriptional regulator [Pseudonocardiales bacterium]
MDLDDARTIGRRVRQIRKSRAKSLVVIAGLAGMSKSQLDRIERGEVALDRLSEIVALANALQVAPGDLMRLPLPAPINGHSDSAIDEVRLALVAVSRRRPGGQVVPVEVLRERVRAVQDALHECRQAELASALPGLIRDVHTSLAAGRDVAELLDVAVLLHAQTVSHWLRIAGAPLDLRRENDVTLGYQLAERRDTPTALGLVACRSTRVLLDSGAFELARADLAVVEVPTTTAESTQLAGALALSQAWAAAASSHRADAEAAVEHAAELAARTGEGTAYGLGFGPTNVGLWQMEAMLEIGDHELVTALAKNLNPNAHPYLSRRSAYWRDYGRALARVPGRHNDAVIALHRAEQIHPHRVQRDPFAREVLAELLLCSRPGTVSWELRGMAYRAGLPV